MANTSRINAFGALDDAIFAGTDSGIFTSHDQGQTWQQSTDVKISGRVLSFAAIGRNMYVGTDRQGILKSSDKGTTWVHTSSRPAETVRALLADQDTLYAGTEADGVFVSKDGGDSWTHLHKGLPAAAQVFAISALKGRLFVGLYSKGLYAWNEAEQRWTKVGRVSPLVLASSGDTLIAGHNPGGIFWSSNLGKTWSKGQAKSFGKPIDGLPNLTGELSSDAPVWELASDDQIAVAGAAAGVYYSEDRGHTWSRARSGLPANSPGVSFLLKDNLVLAGVLINQKSASQAAP